MDATFSARGKGARRSAPTQVHVYVSDIDEAWAAGPVERYQALLSPEEGARLERGGLESGRREFVLGRALARHALSSHADILPEAWTFATGRYGRLEILSPPHRPQLRFSLSHAAGLVACAVAEEVEVGVDIELIDPRRPSTALAERFFAPEEVAALLDLPPSQRCRRFFEYWTLKEAYLKALGLGLSIPLDRFWFRFAGAAGITIAFAPEHDDDPARWRFEQQPLYARHLLAIAVAAGSGPFSSKVVSCVPLT